MLQEGFLTPEKCAGIRFVSDEAELFEFLDGLTDCVGGRADSDSERRQG